MLDISIKTYNELGTERAYNREAYHITSTVHAHKSSPLQSCLPSTVPGLDKDSATPGSASAPSLVVLLSFFAAGL